MATLYTNEEWEEIYNNTNKCKISWKITSITKKLNNPQCEFNDINLLINNWGKTYYINWTEHIENWCIIETSFPIFWENGSEYYPSKWDNIDVILNINRNYELLKYGKVFFNDDIPYCSWNILTNMSDNSENISQEVILDKPVKTEEKTSIQTSTPITTITKIVNENPIIKENFTWEIVSNSNSGIINLPVIISQTNTWWWLIETWSLIASGNLVKTDDIQNESNSGIETEYQTWVIQEIILPIPKKVDYSTQMYGVVTVFIILMITFAYYFKTK